MARIFWSINLLLLYHRCALFVGRMINGEVHPDASPSEPGEDDDQPIEQIQIEEIEIIYSAVPSDCFEPVLELTKSLKSFTYEHQGADIGDAEYECLGIVALLHEFARHSLQHLDLTCNMDWNEEDQAVGDLKDFNALEVLRLNAVAFCLNEGLGLSQGELEYAFLADTLPSSIQSVTLVGWHQVNDPMQFLVGLAEERHKLPELTKICFEGNWNIPKDLVDIFKGVEIELVETEMAIDY
ncbi:MAG: hypothetical protein Q9221_005618 [Calogaya cf. arnoldii]